jgi:hypothetical protein
MEHKRENERIAEELRRISPAQAPAELMERLREATRTSANAAKRPASRSVPGWAAWLAGWRWALAAAPVAAAVMVFARMGARPERVPVTGPGKAFTAAPSGIKPNAVEFDHDLVSTYDAVAELPGGEAVRFRCRKWMDDVVWRDPSRGMEIRQSSPRLEVVPVRFETY